MTDYKKYEVPSKIYLGDNRIIEAYGEGNVELECHDGVDKITLNLHKVLFVPEINKNLLSVPAMTQMQAEVIFAALENEVGIRQCRPKCRPVNCQGRQIFADLCLHE